MSPKAQKELDGFEEITIKEIRDAAEEYQDIKEERMKLTPKEAVLKERLLKLMKKHGKTAVSVDGYLIEVVIEEETVKVRRKGEKKSKDD